MMSMNMRMMRYDDDDEYDDGYDDDNDNDEHNDQYKDDEDYDIWLFARYKSN